MGEGVPLGDGFAQYGLRDLISEPARLKDARTTLNDRIQTLSLENYRVHIDNHNCDKTVRQQLTSLRPHLDDVRSHAGTIRKASTAFQERAGELCAVHDRISTTLQHHTQLLELLEVPQLAETCVRNSLYDEALELSEFVKNLAARHGLDDGEAPTGGMELILWDIVEDTRETLRFMRQHLLAQLRSKATLPACLRIVQHLRKFYVQEACPLPPSPDDVSPPGADPESRLRAEFLACRDAWHTREVDTVAGTSATQVLKVLELLRAHWADIVRQYRALFKVRGAGPSSPAPSPSPTGELAAVEDSHATDMLLHRWLSQRVQWFLALLHRALPTLTDGAAISSVLEEAMRLGSRCARWGADFRPLLIPLFQGHIKAVTRSGFEDAAAQFHKSVVGWGWAYQPLVDLSTNSKPAAALDSLSPPRTLLSYMPAAEAVNAVLSTLNSLRQCLPAALVPCVVSEYGDFVGRVRASTEAAIGADRTKARAGAGVTPGEADDAATTRFEGLKDVLEVVMVPYTDRCVSAVLRTRVSHALAPMTPKSSTPVPLPSPPAPTPPSQPVRTGTPSASPPPVAGVAPVAGTPPVPTAEAPGVRTGTPPAAT